MTGCRGASWRRFQPPGASGSPSDLVVRQRFYRFGIEEALAVGSVALMAISAGASFTCLAERLALQRARRWLPACWWAAAGGLGVYWRFGYVYAAIGAMACVAAVPFQLDIPNTLKHVLAAATLADRHSSSRAATLRGTSTSTQAMTMRYPGGRVGGTLSHAEPAIDVRAAWRPFLRVTLARI